MGSGSGKRGGVKGDPEKGQEENTPAMGGGFGAAREGAQGALHGAVAGARERRGLRRVVGAARVL